MEDPAALLHLKLLQPGYLFSALSFRSQCEQRGLDAPGIAGMPSTNMQDSRQSTPKNTICNNSLQNLYYWAPCKAPK